MSGQSTGTFIAVSRYASATPLPPSILSRGIGWQVKRFMTDWYMHMWSKLNQQIPLVHLMPFYILFAIPLLICLFFSSIIGCWHSLFWDIWNWERIICFCVRFFCELVAHKNYITSTLCFSWSTRVWHLCLTYSRISIREYNPPKTFQMHQKT